MERSGHLSNAVDANRAEILVDTIFNGFDMSNTGFVDFAEITTGYQFSGDRQMIVRVCISTL